MKKEINKIIISCDLCKTENPESYKELNISNKYYHEGLDYKYHICNYCQEQLADWLELIGYYQ